MAVSADTVIGMLSSLGAHVKPHWAASVATNLAGQHVNQHQLKSHCLRYLLNADLNVSGSGKALPRDIATDNWHSKVIEGRFIVQVS